MSDIVAKGDVKEFQPKKPWESTALWGLLVLIVTWAVRRWIPSMFQDDTVKLALEILAWLVGSAMVVYGRWKATRPLGLTDTLVTKQVN